MTTEELIKKKNQALKYFEKYEKLRKDVKDKCHHPESEVIARSEYYSGDYNDRATTEYWNECMICGKCSDKTVKSHSWYG